MNMRQRIFQLLLLMCMLVASACTNDLADLNTGDNSSTEKSLRMRFNGSIKQFDTSGSTRAGDAEWQWKDGDVIYLQYHVGDNLVRGHAVYTKATDSWEAFYSGTLSEAGECEVYFFEGASTSDKKQVTLTGAEPIYTDTQASYVMENNVITLSAYLSPLTSRVQFTGTKDTEIKVSGIKYYTGYDAETNTLQTSTDTLSRKVGEDGYTPYIYGVFADADKRELTVSNSIDGDYISFTQSFPSNVMKIGESGYLTIPTSDTNKGWTEKVTPKLSVSSTPITLGPEAQSKTVTVTTNVSYTVTSSASWLTATSSSDYKTLTLAATANTGVESRTATVTLKNETNNLTATIKVTQLSSTLTFSFTANSKTVTFKMKLVEAGTFQMGKDANGNDVTPVHTVTLTKDYYMGETEVTQALWYAVIGQSPTSDGYKWSSPYGLGDNYPAYYISYNDVETFLTKLNTVLANQLPSGMKFRLPTEAEWEFAAKGGNKSKGYTYSGSNTIGDVAWYTDNSGSWTHAVGTKAANELGLYDMSGNVYEWCYDWYGSYSSTAQTDPTGASSGSGRVFRGGSWLYFATDCRSADRNINAPTVRSDSIGFRLAL